MYRAQGAMGEYFAAQSGMGEYLQASAGMGEYFSGTNGALVDWARQEEAEAGHKGVFGGIGEFFAYTPPGLKGIGEYFGANGLGAMTEQQTRDYAIGAGAGAVVGLLAAMALKKRKAVGAGIGAAVGLVYAYGANAGWFNLGSAG